MLYRLKLLLPALIPSWRFFDWIAPSPRIEYSLRESPDAAGSPWQEFHPRPAHLSLNAMLKRLFWNPDWNASLYLVSCAERLNETEADYCSREILRRIAGGLSDNAPPYIQFRLLYLSREGANLQKQQTYLSPVYHRKGGSQ